MTIAELKSTDSKSDRRRMMAFEMQVGGNHPSYIRNFSQQWASRIADAEIDFVVTRPFFQAHSQVVELVQTIAPDRIRIHCLEKEEDHRVRLESRFREFEGWKIFCKYAELFQADKAMLMYSDHFQLPMLFGRAAPCPVSCIYFRPTFHYPQFHGYQPTLKQRLAAFRKKSMLSRVLKIRQMDTLFCLDPIAVDYIATRFNTHARVRQLPDSFVRTLTPDGRIDELRGELEIENGRRILLLLGILDKRKGPRQLLEAVQRISLQAQQKLCLLLAGQLDKSIEAEVLQAARNLNEISSAQIIVRNHYITDTLVQQYYELADVALTTYQQHIGMSSALIRAAIADIPVLSASYGLMGELVRRHSLGVVVDTTSPPEFAAGIEKMLNSDSKVLFDANRARLFAESHSPDSLAESLIEWIKG